MTNIPDEPLKNVELESAILGLRMALTPEEEMEARQKFLNILLVSTMAVPTAAPVPTGPDGQPLPGEDISLIVGNNADGVSGVPAFTSLGYLRAVIPQIENGMFLNGAQLGGILGQSEHHLFVDGPDLHAEVSPDELKALAQMAEEAAQAQQQAVQSNDALANALNALANDDSGLRREFVTTAFLEGFVRVPIAAETDKDVDVVALSMNQPNAPEDAAQEIELLTPDGDLPCFTDEAAMLVWDAAPRNAIALPGPVVAQLVAQAEVDAIALNPGSPNGRKLKVDGERLVFVEE